MTKNDIKNYLLLGIICALILLSAYSFYSRMPSLDYIGHFEEVIIYAK